MASCGSEACRHWGKRANGGIRGGNLREVPPQRLVQLRLCPVLRQLLRLHNELQAQLVALELRLPGAAARRGEAGVEVLRVVARLS